VKANGISAALVAVVKLLLRRFTPDFNVIRDLCLRIFFASGR
jgi:hypothetical protein